MRNPILLLIFLWVDGICWNTSPFWSILGVAFRKIIKITMKSSEKAENIKVHMNLRSHANFHENPSTRKKVVVLWKFDVFFDSKMLKTWSHHGRADRHKSLTLVVTYHHTEFQWNPLRWAKVLAEKPIFHEKSTFSHCGVTVILRDQTDPIMFKHCQMYCRLII